MDALTRRWQAHTVVRFNGGAQAGHNVIRGTGAGSAGLHHTFSQFGAGTLVPGTRTLLLDPMIVHPTALLVEAEAMGRIGIHDALPRMSIDAQCRITTPYHQAAGRLREKLRGGAAHGTCGVGVGETVHHGLEHPDQVLRYGDFSPLANSGQVRDLGYKLQVIRETLLAVFWAHCPPGSEGAGTEEFHTLLDESVAERWLPVCRALARQCPPASAEDIQTQMIRPGTVLFEGAQGVLLDEWRGFHPHTTWSSINTAAVESVAARYGITSGFEHYGVLRSYLTRHGNGPLPTHDASLDEVLPEPHNSSEGWQGRFRRGHPDAVLLRYALESAGCLSGLLIGHLDVFQRGMKLKWCDHYLNKAHPAFPRHVEQLPICREEDLQHQSQLTSLLLNAQPQYASESITSSEAFLDRVASITFLPVAFESYGVTDSDLRAR